MAERGRRCVEEKTSEGLNEGQRGKQRNGWKQGDGGQELLRFIRLDWKVTSGGESRKDL